MSGAKLYAYPPSFTSLNELSAPVRMFYLHPVGRSALLLPLCPVTPAHTSSPAKVLSPIKSFLMLGHSELPSNILAYLLELGGFFCFVLFVIYCLTHLHLFFERECSFTLKINICSANRRKFGKYKKPESRS